MKNNRVCTNKNCDFHNWFIPIGMTVSAIVVYGQDAYKRELLIFNDKRGNNVCSECIDKE